MRNPDPFDRNHERCIYPEFGHTFDTAWQASNKSLQEVADEAGIAVENVRGYRRGFQKPRPDMLAKMESILGADLSVEEASKDEELAAITAEMVELSQRMQILSRRMERLKAE